jgi:hypothetical protein
MPLTVGTVSVDGAGVRTGTGYAVAIYDSMLAYTETRNGIATTVAQRQGFADYANAQAPTLMNYLTANGAPRIVVPTNAFGAGIPPGPVTINGTLL